MITKAIRIMGRLVLWLRCWEQTQHDLNLS